MALRYKIKVSKDGARAVGQWDISVDISDTDLIASFVLTVDGKNLNTQCAGGNKHCRAADFVTLSNPDEDCEVTFVITTNRPEERHGDGVLLGGHRFDDCDFSNE
jgi:polyisoprenoid-binding protein YceI